MPIPIKPVHSLDLHAEIFDSPSMEGLGLSDIQIQLLGMNSAPKKEASVKLSERYISLLTDIDKNINEVVTAANAIVNNKDGKVCTVPNEISDNELLALKTAGLISGYGRSVSLTDKAKLALRDFYLSSDATNEFRKSRSKEKFDLNEARTVKVSNTKFRRVATWLNKSDELDVRFVAKNDHTRAKGLMHAKPLEELEVAYFVFPTVDCHSFWNKNVDFSLTLAFLDKDDEIVDFKDLEKQSPKLVSPNSNRVKFVVEANKGLFEKIGIKIGDKLILKNNKLIVEKNHKTKP